jgi:ketosteroid isomerase-like protein
MIQRFCILVVVVLAGLSIVAAVTYSAADEALPADLRAVIMTFYESIDSCDVETRIGLLADDVVMMPNHWTMIRGKDAVAESFRGSSDSVFKLRDRVMVRAVVNGDMAYTVNSYDYTYHSKDGGPQWHKTKNVHVWRRTLGGDWRLEIDIWNSDVPISEFENENKENDG